MKVSAVAVCMSLVLAVALGLNNGLNSNGMNMMNGLNSNMNNWNMNNLNNWNGINSNMNNWNGINSNMNNWNGINSNMNNWNGINSNMNRNWNGMNMNGLNSNMNNWNGMNMNSMNILNTNMRNINGGRDDPARLSEGIYDDAKTTSAKPYYMYEPPQPVIFMHSGDGGSAHAYMTSSKDDVMIVATSADDPTEGHVVVAGGDSIGMVHKTDV